ncbi:Na+/H+ antiporter NhaC family protein [Bifidobacterium scaligerum]|uniref:Sodium:proton antiporter n=1 Tax=Bifidobacterium scaligerum TaxID=2052656 RepID=A0A2M9HPS8_9BIFI|nr:Na+/H+ antiporter NhaC family protein [Bifidobacterium scaligerum]PJM78820.1 sodium:proton antiporter [Bifidobacterium scaligerum]
MAETLTMLLFCAALFISVGFGWSIIPALLIGALLFFGYGLIRKVPLRNMVVHAAGSVRTTSTVLGTFVLIGLLTSLWRASGTIAYIVTYAITVIHHVTVLPLSFLLCSGMSVLTGSSFASAATMGTICMSLGLTMGANPMILGGAILAGVYVGDRCSPVSTSALLVAQLTHTNLFNNLGRMVRTGAIPFALSCLTYVAVAIADSSGSHYGSLSSAMHSSAATGSPTATADATDIAALFSSAFHLHWLTVLPAIVVIVLALIRVDVRLIMFASIIVSTAICIGVQGMGLRDLVDLLVFGYHSKNPQVALLLDGGGMASMLTVMVIVCISAAYSGIFAQTHMLDRLQLAISSMAGRVGTVTATVITAVGAAMLACNQTLAIMLTHQLCASLYRRDAAHDDGKRRNAGTVDDDRNSAVSTGDEGASTDDDGRARLALAIEDSAVVIAPLVPWAIASAVPLATINAPTSSLFAAVFLFFVPLSRIAGELVTRKTASVLR